MHALVSRKVKGTLVCKEVNVHMPNRDPNYYTTHAIVMRCCRHSPLDMRKRKTSPLDSFPAYAWIRETTGTSWRRCTRPWSHWAAWRSSSSPRGLLGSSAAIRKPRQIRSTSHCHFNNLIHDPAGLFPLQAPSSQSENLKAGYSASVHIAGV